MTDESRKAFEEYCYSHGDIYSKYECWQASEQRFTTLQQHNALLKRALEPLFNAAHGLSYGVDWNNGTHAKLHGHRQKLLNALPLALQALEATTLKEEL